MGEEKMRLPYGPYEQDIIRHPCPHCGGMKRFCTVKPDSPSHRGGFAAISDINGPIKCADCGKKYEIRK